jgi:transcriptional regulator with XRE-family HTH domain
LNRMANNTHSPTTSPTDIRPMDTHDNNFAVWLENELDKRHWTQRELANRSGLHPSTINYLVKNHRGLGLKSIHKLATALGIPEELIIDQYQNNRPHNEDSELITKACSILKGLPLRDKEEVLAFIYLKRQLAEEHGEYQE